MGARPLTRGKTWEENGNWRAAAQLAGLFLKLRPALMNGPLVVWHLQIRVMCKWWHSLHVKRTAWSGITD